MENNGNKLSQEQIDRFKEWADAHLKNCCPYCDGAVFYLDDYLYKAFPQAQGGKQLIPVGSFRIRLYCIRVCGGCANINMICAIKAGILGDNPCL